MSSSEQRQTISSYLGLDGFFTPDDIAREFTITVLEKNIKRDRLQQITAHHDNISLKIFIKEEYLTHDWEDRDYTYTYDATATIKIDGITLELNASLGSLDTYNGDHHYLNTPFTQLCHQSGTRFTHIASEINGQMQRQNHNNKNSDHTRIAFWRYTNCLLIITKMI